MATILQTPNFLQNLNTLKKWLLGGLTRGAPHPPNPPYGGAKVSFWGVMTDGPFWPPLGQIYFKFYWLSYYLNDIFPTRDTNDLIPFPENNKTINTYKLKLKCKIFFCRFTNDRFSELNASWLYLGEGLSLTYCSSYSSPPLSPT